MPNFRTKKKKRATYVYKDAYGRKVCEVQAGKDNIDLTIISYLHAQDDMVHNQEKKDSYHGLLHYDHVASDEEEMPKDYLTALTDHSDNPETIFFDAIDDAEFSIAVRKVWGKLTDNQRNLISKKLQGKTNVEIAKEEKVTEAAIRNRLAKIQRKFSQFRK